MGRPLNKKWFGNTNYQDFGGANTGGEGVASVTLGGTWTGFTAETTSVTFSAPELTNGETAEGTAVIVGSSGSVTSILITKAGAGYLSAPTVTIADSDGGAEVTGTATAVLTANGSARQNSIKCEAQINSGSEVTTGDIIKQVSTRRYKVKTADGTGVCKLVQADNLNANEMSIVATDAGGATYFVQKLTARKAVLTQKVGSGSGASTWVFLTGASVPWTFGNPSSDQVQIANQ